MRNYSGHSIENILGTAHFQISGVVNPSHNRPGVISCYETVCDGCDSLKTSVLLCDENTLL